MVVVVDIDVSEHCVFADGKGMVVGVCVMNGGLGADGMAVFGEVRELCGGVRVGSNTLEYSR